MSVFTNPDEGTDAAEGWRAGFTRGFLGPTVCTGPPMVLAPELLDSFQEGSLAGATASIEGISFSLKIKPEQEDAVKIGIEAGHVGFEVAAEAFHIATLASAGEAITGGVIAVSSGAVMLALILPVLNLLAALEVYAPHPVEVADLLGDALTRRFGAFGANGPVTVFFVFAIPSIDTILGAAFASQEQAEKAAIALNNGDSFLARLNTAEPEAVELTTVAIPL
jgi:hypothetical protein